MDKVCNSAREAVSDIKNGAHLAIGGFGPQFCWPVDLIKAVHETGVKQLTVVATAMGGGNEVSGGQLLVANRQVKKVIASFSLRVGMKTASEEQILAGELEAELVPQGILVERARAGGAGIPAFYSPSGAGTAIAEGKDVRYFDGKPYVLEKAITTDFSIIRAWRADRAGNLEFKGNTRNLSVAFGKCAKVTIAEVDEIVETGELPPDRVHLPGIFVTRVVKTTQEMIVKSRFSTRRPADQARSYNGKPALTRLGIAERAAALIKEGSYVNLGSGIPEQVSNFLQGRDVLLHAENGMLGYGGMVEGADADVRVFNAGGALVSQVPGASFFDSVTSFEMARGGHLDAVILGAYEVDENACIANWSTAKPLIPNLGGIGGAMDLVAGGSPVIAVLEHQDSKGRPKLRRRCTLPLTGRNCVTWVVTDIALFHWNGQRFVLEETAPGFTAEDVAALSEMQFDVSPTLGCMNR